MQDKGQTERECMTWVDYNMVKNKYCENIEGSCRLIWWWATGGLVGCILSAGTQLAPS